MLNVQAGGSEKLKRGSKAQVGVEASPRWAVWLVKVQLLQ
jgi:hypothetical protein